MSFAITGIPIPAILPLREKYSVYSSKNVAVYNSSDGLQRKYTAYSIMHVSTKGHMQEHATQRLKKMSKLQGRLRTEAEYGDSRKHHSTTSQARARAANPNQPKCQNTIRVEPLRFSVSGLMVYGFVLGRYIDIPALGG